MSMKLLLLACIAAICFASVNAAVSDDFSRFIHSFGIKMNETEYAIRQEIFSANMELIKKHNADPNASYKMGVNQFTHLTSEEFAARNRFSFGDATPKTTNTVGNTPKSPIDWTTKNGVSKVKNQGQCGSCWAFGATGAIESAYLIKGQSVLLSEEELVDCDSQSNGCQGGRSDLAFEYIKTKHGLTSESEYPYTAGNTQKAGECKVNQNSNRVGPISGYQTVSDLGSALETAPVAVAVDASKWNTYESGVFNGECDGQLDHAVLLVGYGTDESGNGFWKIKNSWGESWGERGFIRIPSSEGSDCGITKMAFQPQI